MIEIVISDRNEVSRLREELKKRSVAWINFPCHVQWIPNTDGRLHVRIKPMEIEDLTPRQVESEIEETEFDPIRDGWVGKDGLP